ncbi:MAG: hypothetical protein AAB499_02975, partial [Patescibacteria group bacterium]
MNLISNLKNRIIGLVLATAAASVFAIVMTAAPTAFADSVVVGTIHVLDGPTSTGGTINIYNSLGTFGQSRIYDNLNLHIGTDDNLFLDAPSTTVISGGLSVAGGVVFTQGALNVSGLTPGTNGFYLKTSGGVASWATLPVAAGAIALAPSTAQTLLPTANVVPLAIQLSSGGNTNILNLNSAAGTSVVTFGATGNTAISGTLTVTNDVTLNGNVTLGDAAADTITFTGTPTFAALNATTVTANTLAGSAVT